MKTSNLLFFLCMLAFNNLQAQSKSNPVKSSSVGLNLTANFMFDDYLVFVDETISPTSTTIDTDTYNRDQMVLVGFSLEKIKNKTYHEFDIPGFSYRRTEQFRLTEFVNVNLVNPTLGIIRKEFFTSLRYTYGRIFKHSDKFKFGVGAAFQFYGDVIDDTPLTSASFPTRYISIGVALQVVPKILFKIRKGFDLEIKCAPSIIDLHHQRRFIDNPAFFTSQRINNSVVLRNVFSSLNVSLGLKYQLGEKS